MKLKKSQLLLALSALAITLTGCHSQTTHTVDWYKQHQKERKATLARCENNPGELMATPDCKNASTAQDKVVWGSNGAGDDAKPLTFKKDGQQ